MRPQEARVIGLMAQPEALARKVIHLEGEVEFLRSAARKYIDREELIYRAGGGGTSGEYLALIRKSEAEFVKAFTTEGRPS